MTYGYMIVDKTQNIINGKGWGYETREHAEQAVREQKMRDDELAIILSYNSMPIVVAVYQSQGMKL